MKKFLLLVLVSVMFSAAAAAAQPFENSSVVGQVQDRILVTFKPGVTLTVDKAAGTPLVGNKEMDALARKFAVRNMAGLYAGLTSTLGKASRNDLERVWAIDFDPSQDLAAVEAAYATLPEVESVQRVDICRMYDAYLPDDPGLASQWYLRNMTLGGADVHAVGAWSESLGDSNVVICILDSGVDWHHPDLGGPHPDKVNGAILTNWTEYYGSPGVDDDGNGKVDDIRGWDFVNLSPSEGWPDEDVQGQDNDPMDYGSHGTECAGAAAAIGNNGLGISGVASGCKILPVRCGWLPNNSGQGVVRMDFAAQGMIYAVGRGANIINCSWGSTSSLQYAVDTAQNAGVLVVTAAGNDDEDVASFLSSYPGVIAVAATGSADAKASFSNYGSWVEISAPGVSIYTTSYVASTDTHTYSTVQGTSFSSPITCGAAALIWSALPGLTDSEVASLLYSSADNIDALNPGHVGELGAGRVNLLRALGDNVQRFPQEFPTMYDALNSSAAGDTIAVAGGQVLSGPLVIPGKSLKVLGGFSADYGSRDPQGNPTHIVGQLNNHALKFAGTVDSSTVVDGFYITGGGGLTFSGIPYSARYGGGVMLNRTSPTLRNLEITGNSVGDDNQLGCGGGLAMSGSSAILENVHIHDNAAIYGSGLFAFDSTPTLIDCVIENNQDIVSNLTYKSSGGGIHVVDCDLTMTNCTVRGHVTRSFGGGIFAGGVDASSHVSLIGGEITGNAAADNGAGLCLDGGSLTATRVLFDANSKTADSSFMFGGGINATAATVDLDSLTCTNNSAMVGGGLSLSGNTSATVTNCLIADNTSQFWGGGLNFDATPAGTISGNTIAGNDAPSGGAGLYLTNSSPAVTNNISAFNTGGTNNANGMALLSAPSLLSCNDVFGNANADYSGQPDPTGTDGNISVDPEFCSAATGSYGIATGSPCSAAVSGCGLIGAFAAGCDIVSEVPDGDRDLPLSFRVEQNYPNPFNPKTTIRFALPSAGRAQVNIFDVAGHHVRTLLDEDLPASTHQVTWTGNDDNGRAVSAGIYFYMVTSGANRSVGRMALVK